MFDRSEHLPADRILVRALGGAFRFGEKLAPLARTDAGRIDELHVQVCPAWLEHENRAKLPDLRFRIEEALKNKPAGPLATNEG